MQTTERSLLPICTYRRSIALVDVEILAGIPLELELLEFRLRSPHQELVEGVEVTLTALLVDHSRLAEGWESKSKEKI